ncbi:DUF2809 domain-containing protein [Subsaxibacter sp. CAU 1640]|uniref:ribosomal maturation YjgA family protein n=1 Tax=Subsaxibacter sp. CAU 1640 TaxID=2933271 RepID=UPI00200697E7|nr:DUF2809 domain-containing protein [Subsaxibacter sp. CAU 1640]MCK7591486.1 DUF2809 domain-containing protein [Subsaxibacter sp. CAU 1640]
MKFNKTYFILFVLLLITEALIAIYLKGGFIRHTFGDFLVVILMYCFVKSFFDLKPMVVAIGVLIFSFAIEFLQLTNFLKYFNLENNHIAKIIFGSTFHISDLVAYTLGILFVLLVEFIFKNYGTR